MRYNEPIEQIRLPLQLVDDPIISDSGRLPLGEPVKLRAVVQEDLWHVRIEALIRGCVSFPPFHAAKIRRGETIEVVVVSRQLFSTIEAALVGYVQDPLKFKQPENDQGGGS